jgi:hypothetical protein
MTKKDLVALAEYHRTQADQLFTASKLMGEPVASSTHARAHQHLLWADQLNELINAFTVLGTVIAK